MKTFLAVFNAFPSVLQAVQAVELAVPVPSAGKQKLDLILGATAAAWQISQIGKQLSKQDTLTAVQTMTNLAVATLNSAGVFQKSAPVSSK